MEIGWIDYSDRDKATILAMIDALKDHIAVDELGVGIVRDAIADVLFPATSTLFTRTRYFYLAPYLAMQMERGGKRFDGKRQASEAFDNAEKKLAQMLIEHYPEAGSGIIGQRTLRSSSGRRWVKRGPLEIYWRSLRSLGFLRDPAMSRSELFAELGHGESPKIEDVSSEAGLGEADDRIARRSLWNIDGDLYASWLDGEYRTGEISIDITADEARDLRERYIRHFGDTLLGSMLIDKHIFELARTSVEDAEREDLGIGRAFTRFIAGLLADQDIVLSEALRRRCSIALVFSDLALGCFIRYNVLVLGTERLQDMWVECQPFLRESAETLLVSELDELFYLRGHSGWPELRLFLLSVMNAIRGEDVKELDALIERRESMLKGARGKMHNPPVDERGWIGQSRLTYRFSEGYTIAREIHGAIDA